MIAAEELIVAVFVFIDTIVVSITHNRIILHQLRQIMVRLDGAVLAQIFMVKQSLTILVGASVCRQMEPS